MSKSLYRASIQRAMPTNHTARKLIVPGHGHFIVLHTEQFGANEHFSIEIQKMTLQQNNGKCESNLEIVRPRKQCL